MFSTENFQLPLDPKWGKSLFDTLGNWNTHSSFDEYNKYGGFSSARDARSSPQGRLYNPQSTLQRQPVTKIGLDGSNDALDMMDDVRMTDEMFLAPRFVPLPQLSPPRRQLRCQSHRQIST